MGDVKKFVKRLKLSAFVLLAALLILGTAPTTVSAAPKLNKTTKTMVKGNKYTLRIKGIKASNIKKVTYKTSKKGVVKVRKTSKRAATITAKKKGSVTVKAVVYTRKKVRGKKKFTLKCKVKVKSLKAEQSNYENNNSDDTETDLFNSVDYSGSWKDTMEQINKYRKGHESIEIINDYTLKLNDEDFGEVSYGFIAGTRWCDLGFYNEKEYKEILNEMERIVKEVHITDSMTDQEKAYRLGRYLAMNVEYVYSSHQQTIYGTLFNKETVCGGYSRTYAVLCRYVGIECDYICTDSYGDHAWNIIKLGNYWYNVDITEVWSFRKTNITIPFFRENTWVSENLRSHILPYFLTDEYTLAHPIDTISYNQRCKLEGIPYLTADELYVLPE